MSVVEACPPLDVQFAGSASQRRTTPGLVLKRGLDILLSLTSIIVLAPFLAVIAFFILRDGQGEVFFRQRRNGLDGREFDILKFRTMRRHLPVDGNVVQAIRGDSRITRTGRRLRRYSLDELPQLFNVLRGDMSLVGPRPHSVMHNLYYASLIPGYAERHQVKPGVTGWAQVRGWRGETDTLEKMIRRIECDHHYIANWSLWLDLRIILMTGLTVFFHKNAY